MGIMTSLPATIERHELKYTIPWRLVESIAASSSLTAKWITIHRWQKIISTS